MAEGALAHAPVDIAVSVTGIAGPDGGTAAKPVGLVYLAVARKGHATHARECRFGSIGRTEIRLASVREAVALAARGIDLARTAIGRLRDCAIGCDAASRIVAAPNESNVPQVSAPSRRLLLVFAGLAPALALRRRRDRAAIGRSGSIARTRANPIDISHLNLRDLDMSGLNFKGAKLAGSDLFGADLTGANLSQRPTCSAARLDRVVIIGVRFDGANLAGASLLRPSAFSTLCGSAQRGGELRAAPT